MVPPCEAGDAQRQGVTHRDPHRAARQWIGTGGVEEYAVGSQGSCAAQDGAEVLGVVDAFEDHQPSRSDDDIGREDRVGTFGGGDHPAVQREPDDCVDDLAGSGVERHAALADERPCTFEAGLDDEHGAGFVT